MLDTASLKAAILALLTKMEGKTSDAKAEYAGDLADALTTFVKTATVNIGIPVSTSGGAGSTSGPGTLS